MHLSPSKFKNFKNCEAKAYAMANDLWEFKQTEAMFVGSYIDKYFTEPDNFEKWCTENVNNIWKKNGKEKYVAISRADEIIKKVEQNALFMSVLEGEKQVTVDGEIDGITWTGRVDIKGLDTIVELKTGKQMHSWDWNPQYKCRLPFYLNFDYILQGAIYCHLTGKEKYSIAMINLEPYDLGIFDVPEYMLKRRLDEIRVDQVRMWKVLTGEERPLRCKKCDYCIATRKDDEIIQEAMDWPTVATSEIF